jgi:hypothetical protein
MRRYASLIVSKMVSFSHLGGMIVRVLAIGPKLRGFKCCRGDGFLRALKIRSTPSFGRELKPSAPCRNIYYMQQITSECEHICFGGKIKHLLRQIPPDLLLDV